MKKPIKNLSQAELKVKKEIIELLKTALGKDFRPKLISIEYPPESKLGDFVLPCFLLAKKLKKSPAEVAQSLASQITGKEFIDKIIAAGPYLNFFVNQQKFSTLVLTEIAKAKSHFGSSKNGRGKKVMVEYFSPNTNKPLTIGHIRNIFLGQSITRILKFVGYKVIQSTLYNNRGIAIAKTILCYQKWGEDKTPKSAGLKPDHFVGSFYVKFCSQAKDNPALDNEAKLVLQAWENDQKEVIEVWQQLMSWVLEGFKQTLAALGAEKFDEEYYENEFYTKGKEVVENGLKQGVFIKDKDGVIYTPLEKFGLADKIVLRPDDTSLYITQDLYLAYLKDRYQLDSSIYVVGSEQDLYFKQLFKILELLGFKNIENYFHLSYGMIRLPSGKIKSREGLIPGTGADDLLAELKDLAITEIKNRSKDLSEEEINKRAEKISLAALRYYILMVSPKTTMIFEPKKSVAFTGKTGPYLQYVAARINSIFEKEKVKVNHKKVDYSLLSDPLEFELIKLSSRLPKIIVESVKSLDPSILANYLFELAKAFSLFYEKVPVLAAEEKVKQLRLLIIHDVRIVLTVGLELFGMPLVEKM